MIEKDTVRLLRECDSGVRMAVESISDVTDNVSDPNFRSLLYSSISDHKTLGIEICESLSQINEPEKEPNIMAKGMSKVKTNFMIGINDSDNTIADLITDGCNMGIKSLSRYLNQYSAADDNSKKLCDKLIKLEERLVSDVRAYL